MISDWIESTTPDPRGGLYGFRYRRAVGAGVDLLLEGGASTWAPSLSDAKTWIADVWLADEPVLDGTP